MDIMQIKINSMSKILYLHGLDGSLSPEKKEVLERYFNLTAPQLDYRNTPNMFEKLNRLIQTEKIEAIIGNSMGGCFTYYLSAAHNLPALCFNPALGFRSFPFEFPDIQRSNKLIVFVIGGKDTVVPALQNVEWITRNIHSDFVLKWHDELGHRIDIETFEKEIYRFYSDLTTPTY